MARSRNKPEPQQPPEPTVVEEPTEETPEVKLTPEQIMAMALQRRKEIKGKFDKPEEGKPNWRRMTPKES